MMAGLLPAARCAAALLVEQLELESLNRR